MEIVIYLIGVVLSIMAYFIIEKLLEGKYPELQTHYDWFQFIILSVWSWVTVVLLIILLIHQKKDIKIPKKWL